MLARRNGKFLVFSRFDKDTYSFTWCVAKVEKGMLNVLLTTKQWKIAITGAELLSTGKISEFYALLKDHNIYNDLSIVGINL
jgi:hypothetical protein